MTLKVTGTAALAAALTATFGGSAAVRAQSTTAGGAGGPAGNAALNGSPGGLSAGPVARGGVPSPATHRVMVNGRPVDGDVAPTFVGGTLMVPVRFVTEYLGGRVDWDPSERTATLRRGTRGDVVFTIGSTRATVNREGRALSQAPVILAGRTLIPLREASRFLGAVVDYNDRTQVVFISTPGGSVEPPSRSNYGAMMARP
jgi:hypothetical protein